MIKKDEANNESADLTETGQAPGKIWTATFISLFIANMAFNMGFLMSNALLSTYAYSLGASVSSVGILISTFSIASISFRLVSGPIMDTYNRKYILMISAVLMAIAFFGFSSSTSMPLLMVFRLVQGCGMAFGNSCCLTMVAETLPKDKYGTGIGYYSVAQVAAMAIGPAIGLWLVDLVDFRWTFFITACIMLIAAFLAFLVKLKFKRTKKLQLKVNNIIAKEALLPAIVLFLQHGASIVTSSLLVIFAREQGVTSNIGLYFTVASITMVISRPIIGKLTDRFGLVRVVVPAVICNVIAFFIISNATSLIVFLLAAVIASFGQGACGPALQTLSMKSVTNERRGSASTTNFIGMDMGSMLGPTTGGKLADTFGFSNMWRLMTIPFVVAMCLMLVFRKTVAKIEKNFAERQAS